MRSSSPTQRSANGEGTGGGEKLSALKCEVVLYFMLLKKVVNAGILGGWWILEHSIPVTPEISDIKLWELSGGKQPLKKISY